MESTDPGRRDFLKASGSTFGGAWLALHWPAVVAAANAAAGARAAGAAFAQLGADEARDLEAIAAQIIPSDETPGAREAGVVYFIDAALGSFMRAEAASIRAGLGALNARVSAAHPGIERFAALPAAAQTALLQAEQGGGLFRTLRFLTVAGMFSLPSYGGNRDGIGWKLLGFDHRHVWSAPFGDYDAEAARAGGVDERR